MKYQNAVVGQRVVVKKLEQADVGYFRVGDVGTITATDNDESTSKYCYITLDGGSGQSTHPMYPKQLRKVK